MLVQIEERGGHTVSLRFERSFRIGRDARCELAVASPYVSRIHAHITLEGEHWWITDLASSNGTFCCGETVDRERIIAGKRYYLSKRGPRLTFFDTDPHPGAWQSLSLGETRDYYFGESALDRTDIIPDGESTRRSGNVER